MMDILIARTDVNYDGLTEELRSAISGLEIFVSGGPYGVIVHTDDDVTPAQISQIEQIVLDHDPSVQTPDQITAEHAAAVEAASEANAAAIPGWAHWDEATALAWIEANTGETVINAISNLSEAKAVLLDMSRQMTAMTRMLLALRNKVFPRLEES